MIKEIFRLIRRFLHYFKINPAFTIRYALYLMGKEYSSSVKEISREELFDSIKNGKSLIRLGDGEIFLATEGDLPGQKGGKELSIFFNDIINYTNTKEYEDGNSSFLLGINIRYLEMSNKKIRDIGLSRCYIPYRIYFTNYFNNKAKYFDSHIFYENNTFVDYIAPHLKGRDVIFVSGKSNLDYVKSHEKGLDFKVKYIESLEENSFQMLDEIQEKIREIYKCNKNIRVVLAAGPVSKVVAFNLSKEGVICYDVGMGIKYLFSENPLEKALVKKVL